MDRALESWGKTWVLGELGVGAATNAGAVRALKIGDELVFVEGEKRSQVDGQGMEMERRHRNNQPKKEEKLGKENEQEKLLAKILVARREQGDLSSFERKE